MCKAERGHTCWWYCLAVVRYHQSGFQPVGRRSTAFHDRLGHWVRMVVRFIDCVTCSKSIRLNFLTNLETYQFLDGVITCYHDFTTFSSHTLITPWSNGTRAVSDMPAGPQAWASAWLKLGPQGRLRKILCVCAPFKKDKPSSHPGTGEKIKWYIYIHMDVLLSVAMKVGLSENTTRHGESPRNISTNCDCGQIIMARAQHHSWNQQPNSPARCPSVWKCVCLKIGYPQIPWFITMFIHVPYWTCHQLEATFPFSETSIHHIVEISPSKCPHLYPFIADFHWFSHFLPL